VVLSDIDSDAGERVSAELGTSAAFVRADATDEASIAALVAEAVRRFCRLDVMFNNAAAVGDRSPLVELSSEGIDAALALVTRSVMLGHKHAARQFVAQGSGGAVISTASSASLQGGWGAAAYTAAKHGVVGVVRHAAAELGPLGIRSNAVAPGVILTTLQARSYGVPVHRSDKYTAHLAQRLGPRQPMGRFGVPDDVASVAAFLASDLSCYVNGAVIPVDGGLTTVTQSTYLADVRQATAEFLSAERLGQE
jgi:NAD(P)-dependent dehydrogenase (short-subunit alcohol dehydrogenase family)